jgi:quinoprotein glucose dehydrogenase
MTHESDVLIIGAGISAAMLAQKLSELRPGVSITIVEAGKSFFDFENRFKQRERMVQYGENPWPGDFIEGQAAIGGISRTMAVGGQALHWGGTCNRFSQEDLRLKSMFGLYTDWPIDWTELEKFYCEAERRLGVSGEPSPFPGDKRSEPYPMKPIPLTWSLDRLREWGNRSGIPFQATPQAKNTVPYDGRAACIRCGTCDICPTGARYSPDYTFKKLIAEKKITLHERTMIRKLTLEKNKIAAAQAANGDEYRAKTFVVASGYTWSSHLLLVSGVANSSGLVGKYMNGHAFIQAFIEIDDEIYPNMNPQYGLISRQFFRSTKDPFVRHDLRIWEAAREAPRLKDGNRVLLGDDIVKDWRSRATRGVARVRAYYDIHPALNSELTIESSGRPKIVHRPDDASAARVDATRKHIQGTFERMARNDNGKILRTNEGNYWDHPAGGCRMGADPKTSVVDSFGRTHDHDNLFVVGAPTLPNAGCTNGTLTFVALTLRSAQEIANL